MLAQLQPLVLKTMTRHDQDKTKIQMFYFKNYIIHHVALAQSSLSN